MELFIGVALMLALVVVELIVIRLGTREEVPYAEVVSNLNSGHVVLWLFRGLEIAGYHYALTWLSLDLVGGWPAWLQWGFAFVAWDACFYWLHRIHHRLPSLWSVHVVHHEGEHFSLSLGIRNSWFSSLTSLPFFLPLAVIGVPLEQFIVCGAINYFIQFFNHNHLLNYGGWVARWLITPSHHRVHHGHDEVYRNRNFGGTLVVWDRLFGTFQPELPERPPSLGVNYNPSLNPLWVNTLPVVRWLRGRVGALGLARRSYVLPGTFALWAGLVLFAQLALYVYAEVHWPAVRLPWMFGYLFAATLCLGGMLEGQRWGLVGWTAVTVLGLVWPVLLGSSVSEVAFGLLAAGLAFSTGAAWAQIRPATAG